MNVEEYARCLAVTSVDIEDAVRTGDAFFRAGDYDAALDCWDAVSRRDPHNAAARVHAYYTRRGADLYVDVPVSVTEAALGAKIEVPSLDGMTAVTLPASTAAGAKLRLKGHGMRKPGNDRRGDLYAVIKIVPPKSLSDDERELYEKLASLTTDNPRTSCPWQERATK